MQESLVDAPRVSVLMTAYNASRFIAEALDDLLAQTFTDFELLIVDDGSTDDTLSILHTYASRDPRVIVIASEKNIGRPAASNLGLEQCRAPLIARADADDRYPADRLERQVRFFDEHPEIGILSGAADQIDEEGKFWNRLHFPGKDGQIRMRELFITSFTHPGSMFRTELIRAVGGYDVTYYTSADADLWARMRPLTRSANLDVPLVYYRKHSAASMFKRDAKQLARSLGIRKRLLSDYLQREVSLEEAGAMQMTFRERPVPPATQEQLEAGMRGLREVLRQAETRESADTVRYFKDEVGKALMQHASFNNDISYSLRWKLLKEAYRWAPAVASSWVTAKLKRIPAKIALRAKRGRSHTATR
ncbi:MULTISPECIES: glycosyltransferase [Halomonadaceae]|nr:MULTISPECIES: glycosyltransferase [Halomonas]